MIDTHDNDCILGRHGQPTHQQRITRVLHAVPLRSVIVSLTISARTGASIEADRIDGTLEARVIAAHYP